MQQTFTAVVKQEGNLWIGWIEEIPGVNCQEPTREELLETLRIALAEAIEFNRREARGAAGKGYEELPIAVSSAAPCWRTSRRTVAACFVKAAAIPGGRTRR